MTIKDLMKLLEDVAKIYGTKEDPAYDLNITITNSAGYLADIDDVYVSGQGEASIAIKEY